MASTSDPLQDSEAASSGMAPLRAKWGWIVALGAVYVIAGFFALGSIAMATVASVLVVGPGHQCLSDQELEQVPHLGFARGALHRRGFRDIRKSAARRSAAHARAGRVAGCFRHHADHSVIQHEA
jgi:hypothetical protein